MCDNTQALASGTFVPIAVGAGLGYLAYTMTPGLRGTIVEQRITLFVGGLAIASGIFGIVGAWRWGDCETKKKDIFA